MDFMKELETTACRTFKLVKTQREKKLTNTGR